MRPETGSRMSLESGSRCWRPSKSNMPNSEPATASVEALPTRPRFQLSSMKRSAKGKRSSLLYGGRQARLHEFFSGTIVSLKRSERAAPAAETAPYKGWAVLMRSLKGRRLPAPFQGATQSIGRETRGDAPGWSPSALSAPGENVLDQTGVALFGVERS